MENDFFTALTGQRTHEDLVKKFGLRHILFDKHCLRHILFIKNLLLNHSRIHFISSFLFCLVIY